MTDYFRAAIAEQERRSGDGLIQALVHAEVEGARLTEEEVIANVIITMVGGQETTTNLIGNGLVTLIRNPDQLARLREQPAIINTAVEELLRYETPSQRTARIVREDTELGGKRMRKGDTVFAVMAAGNRDPAQFPDPDRVDLTRAENRHLAFGWASHFCFGAPLARMEGQIAFSTLLRGLKDLVLEPRPLAWRENLGLRGLKALPVRFRAEPAGSDRPSEGRT
jgi:cytochrome P450